MPSRIDEQGRHILYYHCQLEPSYANIVSNYLDDDSRIVAIDNVKDILKDFYNEER